MTMHTIKGILKSSLQKKKKEKKKKHTDANKVIFDEILLTNVSCNFIKVKNDN